MGAQKKIALEIKKKKNRKKSIGVLFCVVCHVDEERGWIRRVTAQIRVVKGDF